MTQQEERRGERGGATRAASDLMSEGRQRIEDFTDAQAQFWDRVQDSNRKWLDRMQNEASIAADFANKLTAAKSFTETASIFQNWTVKHMEMATEDARRVLSDTQEIIAAGTRFWTNIGNGKARGH
jgi:histidinol dehydrogenase